MIETQFDLPISLGEMNENLSLTHNVIEFVPGNRKDLAYRITLPKDWIVETDLGNYMEEQGVVNRIGLFAPSVASEAPFVSVSVTRLPVEINVEDWVDYICAQDEWAVFDTKLHKTDKGFVVDTGAQKKIAGELNVMRSMAFSDGGRIFIVSAVVVGAYWNEWKKNFFLAGISFELVNPMGNQSFEPLKEWEGGNPTFGVVYPSTWDLSLQPPKKEGKSAVDIRLSDGENLLGYILVKVTEKSVLNDISDESLLSTSLLELNKSGIVFETHFLKLGKDFVKDTTPGYSATYICVGKMGTKDVEVRLGYRKFSENVIAFTLISETQEANALLWMRCKGAFEVITHLNWIVNTLNV